jgi:uncharacterized protein YcnI
VTGYLRATLRVPSRRDPKVKYVVVVNPSGVVTCSCPAGWHRRPCWHVKAIAR